MNDAEAAPDDDDDAGAGTEGTDDEFEIEVEADDPQAMDRMMIETLSCLVQNRYEESFDNPRVQFAYDRMMIAAMDRVSRICLGDQSDDQP